MKETIMTNPAQHSTSFLSNILRGSSFAVLLVCARVMIATQLAQAQAFKVIYNFTGGRDGASPAAGLTMDRAGNFYGTTSAGGFGGSGTVFSLSNKGSGWVLNPLYNFTGGSDGSQPYDGVIFDQAGNLYGTTTYGGLPECGGYPGCGTVFNVKPPGIPCATALCPGTETVLHTFTAGSDGDYPYNVGNLIFDQAGNLYGTTSNGGLPGVCDGFGCGTVFKLSPSGSGWTESILYSFTGGSDGGGPASGLIFDQAGNLYGTTQGGGSGSCTGGCGTVFKLSPSGSGWTESVLYSFTGGDDGYSPVAGLILDSSGNLYGATVFGGEGGGGTVFELTPSGGSWTLQTLHSFAELSGPQANLVMDSVGNIYGTNFGAFGGGEVFKLAPSGGGWTYTSLHNFCTEPNCTDGGFPASNVIFDTSGNLYGIASSGGADGNGVVWEITP